ITALMVAAAVGEYAPLHGFSYLEVTTVLSLQAGIILWLLRLSQMGGLVNLLSHPVITGFVNAAAILIVVSQLPALTGIGSVNASDPFHQLLTMATHLQELNLAVVAVGGAALIVLLLVRDYGVPMLRRFRRDVSDEHPIS